MSYAPSLIVTSTLLGTVEDLCKDIFKTVKDPKVKIELGQRALLALEGYADDGVNVNRCLQGVDLGVQKHIAKLLKAGKEDEAKKALVRYTRILGISLREKVKVFN